MPLPVGMKILDSLQGFSEDYFILGAYRTEEFGNATFGTASNISLNNLNLDFGKDPKVISVVLNMALSAGASGVSSSAILDPSQEGIPQNINVYRLKTTIDSTKWFNSAIKDTDYDHTPLNTSSLTYFGGDSIKVYLHNSFGEEILSATKEELDSLELFSKNHKGLYLTCDAPAPGVNGGRLNLFDANQGSIYISYNFQPTWAEGLERKDTLIALNFGYNYVLNTSSYDSRELETEEAAETLYFEGIGGIAPYINGKVLKKQLDLWQESLYADLGYTKGDKNLPKIAIAKASLVFPFEMPANFDYMNITYPSYLFPVQHLKLTDTTDVKYYYLFDDYSSSGNPLGAINRSLMHYECDFSYTIQRMFNKPESEINSSYDLWMYPLLVTETQDYYGSTSAYYSINNNSYYNAKLNGPAADRYPELRIVYTVVR